MEPDIRRTITFQMCEAPGTPENHHVRGVYRAETNA